MVMIKAYLTVTSPHNEPALVRNSHLRICIGDMRYSYWGLVRNGNYEKIMFPYPPPTPNPKLHLHIYVYRYIFPIIPYSLLTPSMESEDRLLACSAPPQNYGSLGEACKVCQFGV